MKKILIYLLLLLFTTSARSQDTIIVSGSEVALVSKGNTPSDFEFMNKKELVAPKRLKEFHKFLISGYSNAQQSNLFSVTENPNIVWEGKFEIDENLIVKVVIERDNGKPSSTTFLYLSSFEPLPNSKIFLTISVDSLGRYEYCSNCLEDPRFTKEYFSIPQRVIDLVIK